MSTEERPLHELAEIVNESCHAPVTQKQTWIVTQTEQFRVRAVSAEAAVEMVTEDPAAEGSDVEWIGCTERSAEPT
jgi:hypothetical protein